MLQPGDALKELDGLGEWDPGADKLLKAVDTECLDTLASLLAKGVNVNGYGGAFHETALHRAAQARWAAGVEYLITHGASVYAKNQFRQTPLHYAAASRSSSCIKLLLASGRPGVVDHRDMRGHTPLHDAASSSCQEAIQLLLKAGALVRAKDGNGETPLHKAARARSIPCMIILLNAGADLSAVNDDGESVLYYMLHHQPGAMDALFDQCLVTNSPKTNTKSLEISLNFVPLVCSIDRNQVQNLQSFVDMGQAKLLCHPLCELFLLLKWIKVRRLFLVEVVFYFAYAILTTLIIFHKFVWSISNASIAGDDTTPSNATTTTTTTAEPLNDTTTPLPPDNKTTQSFDLPDVGIIIVLIQTVLILLQQILSIIQNNMAYFRSLSSILHMVISLLVLIVVPTREYQVWQHHLATLLLLLLWSECMVLIGRFPNCGIYVAMFTTVAKVFVRIFAIYFCLLVAFSSAFYVALPVKDRDKEFSNPFLTFTKTVTMMIGEVDFGEEFAEGLSELTFTGHAVFLTFVILVSIILSNLLVALAVNDVQGLRNSAHLERLIKQTELVFQMEKNFSTASYLASYIKVPKIQEMLGKISFVCKHDCHNARSFVQPNHPKRGRALFLLENKKLKEVLIPSKVLRNISECIRTRDNVAVEGKRGSSRTKRSTYQFREHDSFKRSINDLETSVIEMTEKAEEIAASSRSYDERLEKLEQKMEKILEILLKDEIQEEES